MRFERVGEIMDVDDDMADARRLDPVEAVVDQRLARDAYQRLGPRRGQRPHPLAQPRRHHHRALDPCAHAPCPIHAAARLSAETFASNHCRTRSEEHTSELQSLMRISYAVFCLKKKTN